MYDDIKLYTQNPPIVVITVQQNKIELTKFHDF